MKYALAVLMVLFSFNAWAVRVAEATLEYWMFLIAPYFVNRGGGR